MYFITYFCVEIKTRVITVALLQLVTTSAYLLTFLTSPNDELLFIMVILMGILLSTKEKRNKLLNYVLVKVLGKLVSVFALNRQLIFCY